MISNSCIVDTDNDGYDDYVEEYIGSSPVSKNNKIEQNIYSKSGSSNSWYDWQELIENHSWNYIHNAVEYSNMNNGLIVYTFKKKKKIQIKFNFQILKKRRMIIMFMFLDINHQMRFSFGEL